MADSRIDKGDQFEEKLEEFISRENEWFENPDNQNREKKLIEHEKAQKIEKNRPERDEYFMKMAHLSTSRATCYRRQVGAVIVKDGHLLTTGYNGNTKEMKHRSEISCMIEELDVPRGQRHELFTGLHAEQNAIIQAAMFGVSIKNATLYVTVTPCSVCAKMLSMQGLKKLFMMIFIRINWQ